MYAVSLTEVSPYSWAVIILLAIVNFIRIKVLHSPHHVCRLEDHTVDHSTDHDDTHAYPSHSPTSHDDHHRFLSYFTFSGVDHRLLSGGGDDGDDDGLHLTTACANYEMNYFLFCGALLSLLIASIAYLTWRSECAFLETAMERLVRDDYGKHSNYGKILKALGVLEEMKASRTLQKANSKVPSTIQDGPPPSTPSSVKPDEILDGDMKELLDESSVYHIVTLRQVLKDLKRDEEVERIKSEFETKEFYHQLSQSLRSCCCLGDSTAGNAEIANKKYRINELKKLESFENKFRGASAREGGGGTVSVRGSIKRIRAESIKRGYSVDSHDDYEDQSYGDELIKETNDVFIFSNRSFYKTMIEISLMLFALYTSLWVSHFILIGSASSSPKSYFLIVSGYIVLIFIFISYIQYHSNMILSVTSLRNENAEWMCHQDYIKSKTLPILRNEINDMLKKLSKGEFEEAIKEIFNLVNMDGDEKILLDEFATLLYTLGIHLAHSETLVLFRSMDMDGK
jgi:hypothetical protein